MMTKVEADTIHAWHGDAAIAAPERDELVITEDVGLLIVLCHTQPLSNWVAAWLELGSFQEHPAQLLCSWGPISIPSG
jgi:hypothetical protein